MVKVTPGGALAKLLRFGVLLDKDNQIRGYNESPGISITLRVPYLFQKHGNLCTDASAMMILLAWGFQPNRDLETNPRWSPFTGSRIESHTDLCDDGEIIWRSGAFSKTAPMPIQDLYDMLKRFGPLGVCKKGHAQVLIGVNTHANAVVLHDPWKGPNKVNRYDKFLSEMVDFTWLEKVGNRNVQRRGGNTPNWKQ